MVLVSVVGLASVVLFDSVGFLMVVSLIVVLTLKDSSCADQQYGREISNARHAALSPIANLVDV